MTSDSRYVRIERYNVSNMLRIRELKYKNGYNCTSSLPMHLVQCILTYILVITFKLSPCYNLMSLNCHILYKAH